MTVERNEGLKLSEFGQVLSFSFANESELCYNE